MAPSMSWRVADNPTLAILRCVLTEMPNCLLSVPSVVAEKVSSNLRKECDAEVLRERPFFFTYPTYAIRSPQSLSNRVPEDLFFIFSLSFVSFSFFFVAGFAKRGTT